MWNKTQSRLMALALFSCSLSALAQNSGQPQQPEVQNGNGNDILNPALNRQPIRRTRPSDYDFIPPTPTTTATPAPAPAAPSQPVATPAPIGPSVSVPETPTRRATVTYSGGQLSVVAANSSLNQILRDISRAAGITITGGVAEERVFGKYGPGTPSDVLDDLLDGTSSNVLFVEGSGTQRSELVLTPRTGGPTPPSPNSSRFDADDDAPVSSQQVPVPQDASAGDNSQNTPVPPPPPPDSTTSQPASADSSSSSGNGDQSQGGAKTPQQIFDELMKLRQQNQQKPQ